MILRVNRDYGQFFVIGQFLSERLLLSRVVIYDTYLRQPYRDPGILIRSVCGTVTGLSETFFKTSLSVGPSWGSRGSLTCLWYRLRWSRGNDLYVGPGSEKTCLRSRGRILNVFGMGAVKESEKLDLVINLEEWDDNKMYDRLGLDEQTTNILGIDVPSITLPVSSGRNLSVVIEVAAMNNRQKRMGYNTAKEFNKRLMESMGLE